METAPELEKTINLVLTPSINFALQQNHVPIIREFLLTNNTEENWHNVEIEITSEPEFSVTWKKRIECISKGEIFQLKTIPLSLSFTFLAELTESLTGQLIIKVIVDGAVKYVEHFPVNLLAFDQWPGITVLPEMVCAFVTPNHPEIPKIILRASSLLEKWTGSPSFDEYQSRNPNRVRKQMAAIYEAISEFKIVYCSVPASFEESGQRVRLSDSILANKLGNCLDLSLLYAACLEAVGIHPLIIIIKGHAFAGAWLIDESFADSVNDDPSLLSKRTAEGINEIALVEATCMNSGQPNSFDSAVGSANQKLLNTDDFVLFIDVKRTRFGGIRPLPLRVPTSTGFIIKQEIENTRENILPEDVYISEKLVHIEKIDVTKQRIWERKLLDLTLRNSLLNIRLTKSVIQFITINSGKLEDSIANGEEFQVLAKPLDWDSPLRDAGVYQGIHHTDPISDLVQHELSQKRIRTFLSENELNHSLTHLYRSSKLSISENGANTLFIGLGMLKWYETEASERPRYAPILLLPVEITRKSAQKAFTIKSRQEETIMNITLLEMIRQDFGITIGGLETLPADEVGVDVKAVFNIMRQAIMGKSRWDIEEQALLGTFSFSKFVLWNDIHNNADKLCRNKVVASLVSGKLEWQPEENATLTEISDAILHPKDVALPISTDSSQLQAIISSAQGKSFVLHGPPGTGKSQTITNIIANALYAGKKVLFVASKKVALDVVYDKLKAIGIGTFCLELHSNKSKKSEVLEQLEVATEVIGTASPENFNSEADRLFELRNELNVYVESLHRKYPFGYSLFDLINGYSLLPKSEDKVYFPRSVVDDLTPSQLIIWEDIVSEISAVGKIIGQPNDHPLHLINITSYSSQIKQDAQQNIEKLKELLTANEKNIYAVAEKLNLTDKIHLAKEEDALVEITEILLNVKDFPASMLEIDSLEQVLSQVIGLSEHGNNRNSLWKSLFESFDKEILQFPATHSLRDWNMAEDKWFLMKWLDQSKIVKSLKKLSNGAKIEKESIENTLQKIIEYQEEQQVIDNAEFLPQVLGFLWKSGEPDWAMLKAISENIIKLNKAIISITGISEIKQWRLSFSTKLSEGSQSYSLDNKHAFLNFIDVKKQIAEVELEIENLLNVNFGVLKESVPTWTKYLLSETTNWLNHISELKDWFNWVEIKNKAINAQLQPLIDAYESGAVKTEEVILQFKKGFFKSGAEYIIEKNPNLAVFNGELFSEKIKKFSELSSRFEELTKKELYAKLASKIPSFTQEASQSSEIGFLQKTIRNNGRAISIRKIFDSIPNLLPRLTPCMLMSPISVAQYFDADSAKFDLVIFDEASQMPTCEAIGAIARATNVIVVGDPKQMPPTNFFSSNNIDEENIDKEDLESILDDCLALSMPSQHLLWHYRSKHESLIAFSNSKYYENKLLTFPSTDDIVSKVQFMPVKGFYDKGKTKQNRAEADAIVSEVVSILSDPNLSDKSIGIVTFSSVQQTLIEDLLTDVYRLRPDLEAIALESKEPIFIKNLENVQGDERDIILFSIGYGPDQNGNVSHNFGPINREGGWRRLNVAVSRARYEMKVFSTLTSDRIDLNRAGSEGVAGLKAFLAYAEKGRIALPIRTKFSAEDSDSFENVIAKEIRSYGYEVHTNVGCSDYKIDIAIIDKQNPSAYILGILTDGKNYQNSKTLKDREITQVSVLKMLGWNIHKIWSTEWWEKSDKVLSGVINAIKLAEEHKNKPAEKPEIFIAVAPTNEELNVTALPLNVEEEVKSEIDIPQNGLTDNVYQLTQLDKVNNNYPDEFYHFSNVDLISKQINQVLITEAPISKNLLCKRVLNAWDISRLGSKISQHFDSIFKQLDIKTIEVDGTDFFWNVNQKPSDYTIFRIPDSDTNKRDADDLPPDEVANGVKKILKNQISLPEVDLIRETAKLFGYARIGINVETKMKSGIQIAISHKHVKESGGRVVIIEE